MTGYILLYRSICDHWVWQDPKYLQRWLDLLIRATWERKKKLYFQNKLQMGYFVPLPLVNLNLLY